MKKIILNLIVILTIASCTAKKKIVKIDYLKVSVPEEGSAKFTKYTEEADKVVHPAIVEDLLTKRLSWYAPSVLAVSRDGNKLAYLGVDNEFKNLYIKKVSGGKSVVQRTFNKMILDMAFSPDGTNIAFTERRDNNDDIFLINAERGVAVQQLTNSIDAETSPSFSEDGKKVFFSKSQGDRNYIWSFDIESSLLTQYAEGQTPNLSPDNNTLIITKNSRDNERGEIWSIDIDNGMTTQILADAVKGYSSPQLSPDGETIICVGLTNKTITRPQNLDLYLVKTDGTKLTQITFHGGHDVSPVWSHDGTAVFFLSQRGNQIGDYNVWRMDLKNII